jgi:peptidyl-prolyl cis-trans isomerase D
MQGGLTSSLWKWVTRGVFLLLIGALIVSFAIWGIADVFRGFGANTVARIGSTDITSEHFRQAFSEAVQRIGRQRGRAYNFDQARAEQIDRQVFNTLVAEAAQDQRARSLGIGVTMETIADRVRSNPIFRGPDGNFSPGDYQRILSANNYSEATFLAAERRSAIREQLLSVLGRDVPVPKVFSEALWRYSNEQRSIELVRLTAAQAGEIAAPSEADLKSYFDANKASFRAPEFRKINILQISPETVAANVRVSDEELKQSYESIKERFSLPEKRAIQQISFASADAAKAFADRVAKGEPVETLLAELKLEAVSLGTVARTEVLDPAVAEAAFTLSENTLSGPVASRFGTVIVRVTKIEPARTLSFEEVSAALRQDLVANRAVTQLQALHDKVEDERGAGATLEEISKKLNIPLRTLEQVDRSGRRPDGSPINDVAGLQQILAVGFATPKGVETEAIEQRQTRSSIWVEVADIMPARERTFDEAKADTEKRWRDEQIVKKLEAAAAEIQKKLDAGETFASAAPNLKVETVEGIRRNAAVPGLDSNIVTRVFFTAEGKAGIGSPQNSTDRVVFRVTKIVVPPGSLPAETDRLLRQAIAEDLETQYVYRLTQDLGLRVNETAYRTVTGETRN